MSKAARRTVIVRLGLVAAGVLLALSVIGNTKVDREAHRIRTATPTAHVDMSKILGTMFDAGVANPVAVALGVDSSSVELRQGGSGWCAVVTIRRIIAERDVSLVLSPDGALHPVDRCP